ncbi:phosphotyrosine protein phosphatase [Solemya velum gill symbiont]|uniref:protein-tyrosine-phosphatase n=2 Tax=Solemya velum gill symbiont TaxID=2340 RepID=A0A1T2CIN6_SOVGS|nr:low molecular weight protein-tyrosine-phosphatase [Solemya velum gill symbiont]OOY34716.1 phosphotyrosine protein phosphatase [Solemya velum gill symbiont]OOY37511.1 phosphotyrosine protein phosphatase [Solemya velum gill symbiont]OOY40216.1 phosphotyrosine protein phosphatase [Solemya velum gill symbiont]OOY44743.1 phosphotyrosine protein phosphatase [Solemya velum gill symbiont]OOY45662.1 phosphotyrosine protein phosphatase [Solemya velum gill symbiont]
MFLDTRVKVLFVCMGNICRSPTAHGVFRQMVIDEGLNELIEVDSAGTHAYHVGEEPDLRAQQTALRRGIDMQDLRARKVVVDDFHRFDYVLAMDVENYTNLEAICPVGKEERLQLFLSYAPELNIQEVPDPYYGGGKGFEQVFDMVEIASRGLLEAIRRSI